MLTQILIVYCKGASKKDTAVAFPKSLYDEASAIESGRRSTLKLHFQKKQMFLRI
jgi:hypothetical protein